MNIVGLGAAGCNIAGTFKQHQEYNIYKIDKDFDKKTDLCFRLQAQNHPEKYESNIPDLKNFFRDVKGEVLFVVCGGGFTSGASLGILEQLQHCRTTILYIKPDISLLGRTNKLQEKVVHGVLQEYARSGVFECIYTVDNTHVEEIVGDVPISQYYEKLNELIVSSYHMISVFEHGSPLFSTFSMIPEISRLRTIGTATVDGAEKPFFLLDNPTEKRYYYGLSKTSLDDGKVFKKMKEAVKSKTTGDVKASYAVFSTDYEKDYGYCVFYSSQIQNNT